MYKHINHIPFCNVYILYICHMSTLFQEKKNPLNKLKKKPQKLQEVSPHGGYFRKPLAEKWQSRSHLCSRKLAALGRMRMKFFTTGGTSGRTKISEGEIHFLEKPGEGIWFSRAKPRLQTCSFLKFRKRGDRQEQNLSFLVLP